MGIKKKKKIVTVESYQTIYQKPSINIILPKDESQFDTEYSSI